jgi:hypothetical protein
MVQSDEISQSISQVALLEFDPSNAQRHAIGPVRKRRVRISYPRYASNRSERHTIGSRPSKHFGCCGRAVWSQFPGV